MKNLLINVKRTGRGEASIGYKRHKIRNLLNFSMFIVVAVVLFAAGPSSAVEKPRQGEDILLDTYHRNMAKLETNGFGFPLFLESIERDDRVHVDVYGIFDYPFSSVVNVLKVPANWCDIVSLHPNVSERREKWIDAPVAIIYEKAFQV